MGKFQKYVQGESWGKNQASALLIPPSSCQKKKNKISIMSYIAYQKNMCDLEVRKTFRLLKIAQPPSQK